MTMIAITILFLALTVLIGSLIIAEAIGNKK